MRWNSDILFHAFMHDLSPYSVYS